MEIWWTGLVYAFVDKYIEYKISFWNEEEMQVQKYPFLMPFVKDGVYNTR
jgi:hypothetical protein